MSEYKELSCLAYDLRKKVVEMVVSGKGGHIGGDMSVIDVLVALYFKEMNISPKNMDDPDRDRFVRVKVIPLRHIMRTCSKGILPDGRGHRKILQIRQPVHRPSEQ